MKVFYDKLTDAMYIQFNDQRPEGVVEIKEGVNVDVLPGGKIGGIEILGASGKIDIRTILTYTIDEDAAAALR
jgi:uncharacterized protein YuzE